MAQKWDEPCCGIGIGVSTGPALCVDKLVYASLEA